MLTVAKSEILLAEENIWWRNDNQNIINNSPSNVL